jgi:ABC-type uncharacterized transport system permease subunit
LNWVQREGRADPVSKSVLEMRELPRLLDWIDPNLRVHAGIFLMLVAVGSCTGCCSRPRPASSSARAGENPDAARYAGMRASLIIVPPWHAGALAGLAGANQVLGVLGRATPGFSAGHRLSTPSPSLLGRSHPVGVLFAGLLFGALEAGGRQMQVDAGVSIDLIGIIQALIIVFIAAPLLVRAIFPWGFRSPEKGTQGWPDMTAASTGLRAAEIATHKARQARSGSCLPGSARGGRLRLWPGDATFRLSRPTRRLGACRTSSCPRALQLHRGGGPRLSRRAPVPARRRALDDAVARLRAGHLRDGLPRLGDGGQVLFADRHAAGHDGARGADRARRAGRRMSERVAVVNIAIEGMLLAGAFTGALMGSVLGGWGGLASPWPSAGCSASSSPRSS